MTANEARNRLRGAINTARQRQREAGDPDCLDLSSRLSPVEREQFLDLTERAGATDADGSFDPDALPPNEQEQLHGLLAKVGVQ